MTELELPRIEIRVTMEDNARMRPAAQRLSPRVRAVLRATCLGMVEMLKDDGDPDAVVMVNDDVRALTIRGDAIDHGTVTVLHDGTPRPSPSLQLVKR